MNEAQSEMHSTVFSLLVIGLAAFILQRFFLPLVWAGILCVATWPLYRRLLARLNGHAIGAAALLTALMLGIFLIPTALGLREAIEKAPLIASFVARANTNGIEPPAVLLRIPSIGEYVHHWWIDTLAQPHGLAHLLSDSSVGRLISPSSVLKSIGTQLFHRLVDFFVAFLCLFFFYKDGLALHHQVVRIGSRWFGPRRWDHYYQKIPTAIRATVNGLVLVGLGEGLLIGAAYGLAGLPSPVLWGALTCVLAIVPFGAPVVFLGAAAFLLMEGHTAAAVGVALWGAAVLVLADHLIRPSMIGSATRLPFLAVLFGILGGVEALGLIGLFVGPVLMVLMITLWRESGTADADDSAAT